MCTIVEKNVNDSRDFCLYLWSAVNVRKTVEYIAKIYRSLSCNCRVWTIMGSHNNNTIMAADVDELVDFLFFRVLDSLLSQCQRSQCN